MKRFPAILITVLLAVTLVPTSSAIARESGLSGTIVLGHSGLHHEVLIGCEMAPDCRAWLASDCDPDLTGRDPAVGASIEDVSKLRSRTRNWVVEHADGAAAWAEVELWRSDCTEIRGAGWGSGRCATCTLHIPASAKWMTVTGYTYNPWAVWLPIPSTSGPLTLNWELRRA